MSEAQCGYRAESCSDIGRMVNGKWQCQRHIDMDELQRLRDERDRLREALERVLEQWVNGRKVKDGIGIEVLVAAKADLMPAGGGRR